MTRVSIIIPTHNRVGFLKYTIQSCIEQIFQNLEIIVSDDHSTDNTKETVYSFHDPRINYVRPPYKGTVSDNFEFGRRQATGEYLIFLTDKTYLLREAVEFAVKELEDNNVDIVAWRNAMYITNNWHEPFRKNTLYIPKFSSKSLIKSCSCCLTQLCNSPTTNKFFPKIPNIIIKHSLIHNIISVQKKFFLEPIPDMTSTTALLLNCHSFIYIDRILSIATQSLFNIGASQSFTHGKSADEFLNLFSKKTLHDISYLGIYTTGALMIQSILNVLKCYNTQWSPKNIINIIANDLCKLDLYSSRDTNRYWKSLLNSVPLHYKFFIFILKIKGYIKWASIKFIRRSRMLYKVESIRNVSIYPHIYTIDEALTIIKNKIRY